VKKDALDLLRAFIDHEVRFLLVGAHAVGFYAQPRATGDIDFLIEPTQENALRAYNALEVFGAPLLDLKPEDLSYPGIVYQMGVPPYRIDILTEISGVSFEEAWQNHEVSRFQEMEIPVISFVALVKNKQVTGRTKDLFDLDLLSKHRKLPS
jgi:hypothetical protein